MPRAPLQRTPDRTFAGNGHAVIGDGAAGRRVEPDDEARDG